MVFGKKASKENTPVKGGSKNGKGNTEEVHKEVLSENSKSDSNSDISISNDNNRNDSIVEEIIVEKTKLKFKRKDSAIKHNKLVMFGQTSEEKLQLFIDNIKRSNPTIPDYFLQKEIEKFNSKLGV